MSYANSCRASGALVREFAIVDRGAGWLERVYVCPCGTCWPVDFLRGSVPVIPHHQPREAS